jgi:hypothetical protein
MLVASSLAPNWPMISWMTLTRRIGTQLLIPLAVPAIYCWQPPGVFR